jgi:ABC-type nitrate/sulfonate/bicarbonate transport system substrate-binding protein
MIMHNRKRFLALLAVMLLGATACAGETDGEGEGEAEGEGGLPVVKLHGLEGGLSSMALKIIEEQGFDEANGFQGEYFEVSGDASVQFLLQGNSDVSFDGDPITAALLRSQGNDITTFYPMAVQDVTLMVRGDSPYQSAQDLMGERVGHDGLESGGMTAGNIMLSQFEDVQITEDYNLQLVPEPALIRLLDRGELEASFMAQPFILTAMLEFGMRPVWGPGWEEWEQARGGRAWNITVMASEQWLRDNPDLARGVTAAWDDVYNWITEDPERLAQDPFPELIGIEDPEVLDAFVDLVRTSEYFTNRWTEDDVEAARAFIEFAAADGTLIQEAPEGSVMSLDEL